MNKKVKIIGTLKLQEGTWLPTRARVDSIARYFLNAHNSSEANGTYSIRMKHDYDSKNVETDRELKKVLKDDPMFADVLDIAFSIANSKTFYFGEYNKGNHVYFENADSDIRKGLYIIDDLGE